MNRGRPDLNRFEKQIFKTKRPLRCLLKFSLTLMEAKQTGLLYGTNRSGRLYLSPEKWDRGMMHMFDGVGSLGIFLKYFGTTIVRLKGLSPVLLYKNSYLGGRVDNIGIIPFVLRKHKDYYKNGLNILIIDHIPPHDGDAASDVSVFSYDGKRLDQLPGIKINNTIARYFNARNFISGYIPDYGAIVFNTISLELLKKESGDFVFEDQLTHRLDILMAAIEMTSLANIGRVKGRQTAEIIWRKEKRLRRTAQQLKDKKRELLEQKAYLRSVGAVNEHQLNMEPVNVNDGIFAFMDMVGSAVIRKKFSPKDYFFILNLCDQIVVDTANRFHCRVDNFIGDSVFLLNTAVFDDERIDYPIGPDERGMLMVLAMAAVFHEIEQLKEGKHAIDPDGRVKELIERAGVDVHFRAGIDCGSAIIGPLGSEKRKIVTAIGKAVNTASRLESSGAKQKIHLSRKMMTVLENGWVTTETKMIKKAITASQNKTEIPTDKNMGFFEFYKAVFNLKQDVVEQQTNISYKEYAQKKTYLLQTVNTLEKRPANQPIDLAGYQKTH